MQLIFFAFCFALASAGSNSEASMPMMAITTSNSISVKPGSPTDRFVANVDSYFRPISNLAGWGLEAVASSFRKVSVIIVIFIIQKR